MEIVKLKIEDINVPHNYRKKFDNNAIKELAASISDVGLLNPITVDQNNNLISGECRLRAMKLLGAEEIDSNIIQGGVEALKRAGLAENIQRASLHPMEEANAFMDLFGEKGKLDPKEIALTIGKSESYVKQRLVLLGLLTPLKIWFLEGAFGIRGASYLASCSEEVQVDFLENYGDSAEEFVKESDLTYKEIYNYVHSRSYHIDKFTPELKEFSKGEGIVGACLGCVFNSNNSLFPSKEEVCSKPSCADTKLQKWTEDKVTSLKAEGKTPILMVGYSDPLEESEILENVDSFSPWYSIDLDEKDVLIYVDSNSVIGKVVTAEEYQALVEEQEKVREEEESQEIERNKSLLEAEKEVEKQQKLAESGLVYVKDSKAEDRLRIVTNKIEKSQMKLYFTARNKFYSQALNALSVDKSLWGRMSDALGIAAAPYCWAYFTTGNSIGDLREDLAIALSWTLGEGEVAETIKSEMIVDASGVVGAESVVFGIAVIADLRSSMSFYNEKIVPTTEVLYAYSNLYGEFFGQSMPDIYEALADKEASTWKEWQDDVDALAQSEKDKRQDLSQEVLLGSKSQKIGALFAKNGKVRSLEKMALIDMKVLKRAARMADLYVHKDATAMDIATVLKKTVLPKLEDELLDFTEASSVDEQVSESYAAELVDND